MSKPKNKAFLNVIVDLDVMRAIENQWAAAIDI